MSKKLTIGFACFDDVEGAFFTLGALRFYHHKNLDDATSRTGRYWSG